VVNVVELFGLVIDTLANCKIVFVPSTHSPLSNVCSEDLLGETRSRAVGKTGDKTRG